MKMGVGAVAARDASKPSLFVAEARSLATSGIVTAPEMNSPLIELAFAPTKAVISSDASVAHASETNAGSAPSSTLRQAKLAHWPSAEIPTQDDPKGLRVHFNNGCRGHRLGSAGESKEKRR